VLGLEAGSATSRGLQVWQLLLGVQLPYRQAAVVLEELAGLALGADTLRRTCTEVGTALQAAQERAAATVERTRAPAEPVQPAPEQLVVETDGVMVRFDSGWHEAKVGLVAGCRPAQPGATGPLAAASHRLLEPSYIAARASPERFGPRLLAEAARRGALEVVAWEGGLGAPNLARLRAVLVLGDGAVWIWHLAGEHFGERIEIVDFFHAAEHLAALGRALWGDGDPHAATWARRARHLLLERGAQVLLPHLARARASNPAAREALRRERGYFTSNAARMDYPAFRARGLPIGSGAVESEAKTVVQGRMKRSGMRWGDRGGEAILGLSAYLLSGRPLDTLLALPAVA
jgi:hypothetical protein